MKIAIIGGGITGLSTALALKKMGIESSVYEQAEELSEIGAGVWLQPNAMQVMNWLGLKNELKAAGAELQKMEITNQRLIPFKKIKQEVVQDSHGNQTIAIHRGRLQAIMANHVGSSLHLGKSFKQIKKTEAGHQVSFEDGSTIEADIVLGADGIKSKVRQSLFSDTQLRMTNQLCWRGIAKISLPDYLKNKGKEAWGPCIRFGFSNISDDEVYWFGVAQSTEFNQNRDKDSLLDLFKDYDPIISEIIKHTEKIHIASLGDLRRLKQWHQDGVCLMGDAAHATTPNMGQGACQGIEDAYFMAHLFEKHAGSFLSFDSFESLRRKKVDYIVNNSWRFGQAAHNRMGQAMLKLIMKATPESVMSKQMNQLYSLDVI